MGNVVRVQYLFGWLWCLPGCTVTHHWEFWLEKNHVHNYCADYGNWTGIVSILSLLRTQCSFPHGVISDSVEKWGCGDLSFPIPWQHQCLDGGSWTKPVWEASPFHLGGSSHSVKQTNKQSVIAQEVKEDNFLFPASFHSPSQHCSGPGRNVPASKNSSHQGRKSGVNDQLF